MDAPKSLSDTYYHSQEIQQDVKAHGSDSIGVAPSHHGEEVLTSPFGVDSGANEKQTEHVANPRSNPTRARRVIRKMERGWRRFLRPQSETHLDISLVALGATWYGVLFFSIGTAFLPGHPAWATLLLWASALIGAFIAHQLHLPRVLGMLVAGILLRNIPWGAIDSFPDKWGVQMRAAALATIFLRCGLELDFGTMNRFKYPAMRLALIPGLAEALFDAGLATVLFDMDYALGLTMGFILKAVGPGLVVPEMFRLQCANIGTDEGIPSTVVIAASFDDVIAITGYAIFSTIAIQPDSSVDSSRNPGWTIASGPVQVVFGFVGGVIAGYIIGATRIWNTALKRFAALFGAGLLLMFFLEYFELLSGGALGALFTGLVASNLWERGTPKWASLGPSFLYTPEAERGMSVIWRWVMEPILFVTVGSALDFSEIESRTIPKSIIIICSGLALRILATYFVMSGFGYRWKEKLFYAIAWTPKATVQAALSAAPLALIKEFKNENSPDYEQWIEWGNDILTTGLFAIIICGTLGIIAIHFAAPLLLKPGTTEEKDESIGRGSSINGESGAGSKHYVVPTSGRDGRIPMEVEQPSRSRVDGFGIPAKSPTKSIQLGSQDKKKEDAMQGDSDHPRVQRSFSMEAADQSLRAQQRHPQLIAGEDLDLVAEYIESIRHLMAALRSGDDAYSRHDVLRLSDRVLHMQERVEAEVGHRQPSVRELFRTAATLAPEGQRPLGRGHRAVRSTGALPSSWHGWDFIRSRSQTSGASQASEEV